ncbi:MAG TPA: threonine synthase, partial [Gammaproteobacteria bacterium]|nr:threonine synthase [Gammaproteobacteria bacterium]
MTTASLYTGLIDKYRDRLPLPADAPAVSLCEGQTPLIRLANIERDLGGDLAIYAKFEGLNPTGSFKDRGMTVAVTQAVAEGSRAIICAS